MANLSFAFPQPLTDKYRPAAIADFVGLERPKAILGKLAANPFPSAWLFVGAPGTGKTTLGMALAAAIPAELHHVPSQDCTLETVERVRRTCQYVPQAGCAFHLVLVDEADRMSYPAQVAFLSKLDATDFPPTTIFVFTCNSVDGLEARFLSRCRVLEFGTNGKEPLIALLQRVWESEGGPADCAPDWDDLVWRSRGNVRDALMNLELELMAPTPRVVESVSAAVALAGPVFRLESPEPAPLRLGSSSAEMLTRLQMRADLRARRLEGQA